MTQGREEKELLRETCAELVAQGTLQAATLERALRAADRSGERIDLVLSRLGLATEDDVVRAMAKCLGVGVFDHQRAELRAVLVDEVPYDFLKRNLLVPVFVDGDSVTVASADPINARAIAALGHLVQKQVTVLAVTRTDFSSIFQSVYEPLVAQKQPDGGSEVVGSVEDDADKLRDLANEAPVITLVSQIITGAVEQGASDIHVEPQSDCVWVRQRIDGELIVSQVIPLNLRSAVTSRIKLMADLNIAERRLPQDGHLKMVVRGREIDFRVSCVPTLYGESVVLRILDQGSVALEFADLGFDGSPLANLMALLCRPNGIVLVTGPTGSGKSTTLYAALKLLNDRTRKIYTVEDPVEYFLPGANQLQVHPKIGLDFATSLRSILRQDPDVIMIGEIRDSETARIAVQASLTGHLVLSTLHTNSAAATIPRLLDMGIEEYLLASTISGVVAQRLVRRLCEDCAVLSSGMPPLPVEPGHLQRLVGQLRFRRSVGCARCRGTGFAGRTSIMELMVVTDSVRERIQQRASAADLVAAAASDGMETMLVNGLCLAGRGVTTVDEVLRVASIG